MKSLRFDFKTIGIILSYAYMLIACYVFHWKPFGIFISYLIEIVVMTVIYCYLRIVDKNRNPGRYRKIQPLVNVIIGVIPLIMVQYFLILLISSQLDKEDNLLTANILMRKEIIYALIITLILYIVQAAQIRNSIERLELFQENFLFKMFAITVTNLLGILIVLGTETHSLLLVLSGTVIVRVGLEIYFGRKMRFI